MRKPYVNALTIGAAVALASSCAANLNYGVHKPPTVILKSETLYGSFPLRWAEVGPPLVGGDIFSFRKLKRYSAQYNQPETLPYGRSTEFIFVIEGDKPGSGDDLLKSFVGRPQKTDIAGADQMSATLTGPKGDVEITPRGAELQTVTSLNFTKWIWDIEPKRTGSVILSLDVFAQFTDETKALSDEIVTIMPTKRIEIPVTVTLWDSSSAASHSKRG